MRKSSKLVCGIGLCIIVCALSGGARLAAQPGDLPKSPLEVFATRSKSRVTDSFCNNAYTLVYPRKTRFIKRDISTIIWRVVTNIGVN